MEPDRAFAAEPFLAKDAEGRQAITLLMKLAYALEPSGALSPLAKAPEFVAEDVLEPKGDEPGYYPTAEMELVPFKVRTDVVVTGTARTPEQYPRRDMRVSVRVGRYEKEVQVFGERRVEVTPGGSLRFTEPEPFTEMPLTYTRAYGGVDPSVPRKDPQTVYEWMEFFTLERHPGVYPRNPVGAAYVVNPHLWLLNGRPLPNFEDPADLLTPERMAVKDPRDWWRQPLPAGLGWFGRNWYPRCMLGGLAPPLPAPEPERLREVELGVVERDYASRVSHPDLNERLRIEFFNGASPGLALPLLRGDEPVSLRGLDPAGERRFALPGEVPPVTVAFQGKLLETRTHLHTLIIHKDDDRVEMIWSAQAQPPRMLPLVLPTREAPVVDELDGVEIRVAGREVGHAAVDMGGGE